MSGRLRLLRTALHECGYLPQRTAGNVVVDPAEPLDPRRYAALLAAGFRRSGALCYRPACPGCNACVPLRVDVQHFAPSRAQRRCLRRNADLSPIQGRAGEALADGAMAALYRRYLADRHPGGGMDGGSDAQMREFLLADWADSELHGARLDGRPVAAVVVDPVPAALSAVYAFFDPALADRSLGRWCVLHLLQVARERGLRWLYLGYWIAECRKMRYKTEYRPAEMLRGEHWVAAG